MTVFVCTEHVKTPCYDGRCLFWSYRRFDLLRHLREVHGKKL